MENARTLYEELSVERELYIHRAEECARLTIPFLFPKEGDNSATKFPTPYQAVGARGVNNLGSKMLLALFPPNTPFYRMDIRKDIMEYLSQIPEDKQKIEQKLVQEEQTFQKHFETQQYRVTLRESINQLIVAGNNCLFLPPKEGGMKMYKLNSYVVQRDFVGNVIQLVTLDKLAVKTIPSDVLAQAGIDPTQRKDNEIVEIYTHVVFDYDNNTYESYQEIEGAKIKGYEQSGKIDTCPWIPLRLYKMDGENYSRSYVEEYIGDLKTLEGLSQAIVEASAIAASIVYLVNPNGVTQISKLNRAKNGGYVPGRPEDVVALQLDKQSDMQIAKATADALESRLSYAFMLNSAVQRNAERVTAEEIRYVANELEDTLGGIYSILSQELQLPLVKVIMNKLQRMGEMADIPADIAQPAITTGVEAIGRGHDLSKLQTFVSLVGQNPEAAQVVKWNSYCQAVASACNLDTTGLIKTDEEIQQEQQQMQMAQMMQAGIPNATKGMMDAMNGGTE